MAGVFSFLYILVANVYPIIESFKTFENYSEAKRTFEKSNLNIAGFNVPINSLIKKATGDTTYDESKNEAVLLVYHTNQGQKWLIYWIINSSIDLVSSILLLKYVLPFYTLLRLGLSMWLLVPFFKLSSNMTNYNETEDLNTFYQSGCGLCYASLLKPWLKGEKQVLENSSLDPNKMYEQFSQVLKLIIGMIEKVSINSVINSKEVPSNQEYNYVGSLRSLTGLFREKPQSSPQAEKVEDEYDVIEGPIKGVSTGIEISEPVQEIRKEGKKGWLW